MKTRRGGMVSVPPFCRERHSQAAHMPYTKHSPCLSKVSRLRLDLFFRFPLFLVFRNLGRDMD